MSYKCISIYPVGQKKNAYPIDYYEDNKNGLITTYSTGL